VSYWFVSHFSLSCFRIGGGDDILRGKSTFCVEMEEMSFILGNADNHSLVLIGNQIHHFEEKP
jgi:dsDNA-specific endonuclease/ATPase MutS2